jgi:hypothetical protein
VDAILGSLQHDAAQRQNAFVSSLLTPVVHSNTAEEAVVVLGQLGQQATNAHPTLAQTVHPPLSSPLPGIHEQVRPFRRISLWRNWGADGSLGSRQRG